MPFDQLPAFYRAQVLSDLEATRACVAKGWCQRSFARRVDGKRTNWLAADATSHCLTGAMYVAMGYSVELDNEEVFGDRLNRLRVMLNTALRAGAYQGDIVAFNDDPCTTKEAVLDLLDRAIVIAKEKLDAVRQHAL